MEKIIVIDFGSQYNQLIVRRIRDLGVYSELVNLENVSKYFNDKTVKGFILSGGPNSVFDENSLSIDKKIFECNKPVLGICYGMQLMTKLLGGEVEPSGVGEYGRTEININNKSLLTTSFGEKEIVWMSHMDKVIKLPKGFVNIAFSNDCPNVIIENNEKKLYGIQFHAEVTNTINGIELIKNFVFNICQAKKEWNVDTFIDKQIEIIKKTVKDEKVILGLSGGVDSSVAAALIQKAIGKQLFCVFVDHGLLRKNEAKNVIKVFKDNFNMNLITVNAKKNFLEKLKNVTDPEQKRKIIGNEFIKTFENEQNKLTKISYLAQGTLYTDVIESGTKTAQVIKSHHNVGGLPKNMKFKLLEPLNILFKDEVRLLGSKLGLPDEIINRQPFPGPGLAIRIIGEITEEKIKLVQESDAIFNQEIKKAGLDKSIWQYFTILLNNKSVGVMGDQRTYSYTLALRAVDSIDGMTADWSRIPYDVLAKASQRIVNEVKGINRIVYDITSKPPGTIEWE
ncbi:glutamine-hydrolyzing GMP synthase [Mycoplasma sp. Mirounga ES2805-ORL]|uniref:glutamine-hydrolyzing GMP synthase n=1 Tax=Mycoplasma sp. Mirounga ES2805-ORL TaxID=754514 RepID=UPI00197C7715|nr:glutamine-hydrolyzing GMP synthase [Mycoplasma sp. Mirounga ES2805-ORL]QSF13815.1 glutamine-hydrolyzing GMP synthase [Mycoplasma sp. Mirounga ES2805-ORL]